MHKMEVSVQCKIFYAQFFSSFSSYILFYKIPYFFKSCPALHLKNDKIFKKIEF